MKKIITLGIILCPGIAYGLGSTCSSIMPCRDGYTFNPLTCICEPDRIIGGCTESCSWSDVSGSDGLQEGLCSLDLTDSGLCTLVTQYRCAAGYYGKPTSSTSTCAPCPGGAIGATSKVHDLLSYNTDITGCYMPSGTLGIDDTGIYTFTEDCHYTEN